MITDPVEFILMFSTGFVALVLLISGAAKIANSADVLASMSALRVPVFARRRWIAAAVPAWEICLGLALLLAPGWMRVTAAVLAACTFVVFTLFIAGVLSRGEEVDCGCFGPLAINDRVTAWTIARNILLIMLSVAIAVTVSNGSSFVLEFFGADIVSLLAVALAWALVVAVLLLTALLHARRSQRDTIANEDSLPLSAVAEVGVRIPDAELVSSENVTIPLHALGSGSPVLLVFLSAECSSCAVIARRLDEWQKAIRPVTLRVATSSRPDVLRERMPDALPFAYFGSLSAKRALGVQGSAAAVLLGGSTHPLVASPVVRGEAEIDALVNGILDAQSASTAS
ncbi:MauE/DoxX family redox-associated membrane protein [Microbacterium murale]|uniref:Methylamine utilisation protein MauE domain-containing protein n=1 Tax=Microbacterium murale TaxID=1081040 RepID=A0ABU0PB57_9MICO|nr:MauE/DoxX family redox-associated membrane protein [Microbacterium murale]MDQ0644584.1 hypothetical protein [Microbacterium murale]